MHHSIWSEHDGSWTWSIEEGKAFEDDHKVLARDEGFPTRGDAKEAMQAAWASLLQQGKKPGRPGAAKPAAVATAQSTAFSPVLPTWAVVAGGEIIALFARKDAATAYAKNSGIKNAYVEQIQFGAVAR